MKNQTSKITVHKELSESNLGAALGMVDTVADGDPRGEFIGKVVRYKAFEPRNGTVTRDFDFKIGGVQNTYNGTEVLRGNAVSRETGEVTDTFGRPIRMEDVEIVDA
jgi:hypothetical protein